MKLRTDFVSNSSSSSFIIGGETKTIQVAKEMLEIIMVDNEEYYAYDEVGRALKHLKKKSKDFDKNIIIPWSCNYETFIYRNDEGLICVETSWNHPWQEYFTFKFEYGNPDEKWDKPEFWHERDAEFLDLEDLKMKTRDDFMKHRKYVCWDADRHSTPKKRWLEEEKKRGRIYEEEKA